MSDDPSKNDNPVGDDPALARMHNIVDKFLARPDSGPFREPVDWRGLELYDYPVLITTPMDLGTIKRKLERHEYKNAATCAYEVKLVWKNCQTYNSTGSDFWLLAKSFARRFEDLYRKVRQELDVGEEPMGPKAPERRASKAKQPRDSEADDQDQDESSDADEEHEYSEDEMMDDAAADEGGDPSDEKTSKNQTMQLDEKAQFAAHLLMLDGIHMGKVVSMLRNQCPAALEPWNSHDDHQMEISVDKLMEQDEELFRKLCDFVSQHAIRLQGASAIEEAVRRMHADPADLVQPHVLQDENGKRGRPRSDARNIMQIDVSSGQVLHVYTSLTSAAQALGISRHIVAGILRGTYKSKSFQGWTFKYDGVDAGFAVQEYEDEDDDGDESKQKKRRKSKPSGSAASPRAISVQEIDAATGKLIRTHQSLTKASRVSGANRHVICKVLAGELPEWHGLKWQYCGEEDEGSAA